MKTLFPPVASNRTNRGVVKGNSECQIHVKANGQALDVYVAHAFAASIGSGAVVEQRSQTADSSARRSGSSSDISVLSNPSQCSIEVLSQGQQPQQSEVEVYSALNDDNEDDDRCGAANDQTVVPEPELKTSALTPLPKKLCPMMESSSSGT